MLQASPQVKTSKNSIQMFCFNMMVQALFQLGTDACSREEYKLCYCAFQFFQQSFPHVLEGYIFTKKKIKNQKQYLHLLVAGFTNAAVALERIGRLVAMPKVESVKIFVSHAGGNKPKGYIELLSKNFQTIRFQCQALSTYYRLHYWPCILEMNFLPYNSQYDRIKWKSL